MPESQPAKMPWAGIAIRSGQAALGVATFLVAVSFSALRRERLEQAELHRQRWTDANRWE
jgi:hypothetical protein